MTKENNGGQNTLESAKEALNLIDKVRFPKRYNTQEELIKALELADNQKIRAEKAERKNKKTFQTDDGTSKNSKDNEQEFVSSLKDIRALSDVHDDDVETLMDLAKFKGISITEAKKDSYIMNYLRTKNEERATAQVSNTSKGKQGFSKISGQNLLNKVKQFNKSANDFNWPETEEGMEALIEAQFEKK